MQFVGWFIVAVNNDQEAYCIFVQIALVVHVAPLLMLELKLTLGGVMIWLSLSRRAKYAETLEMPFEYEGDCT
jgi:hypothetical protein